MKNIYIFLVKAASSKVVQLNAVSLTAVLPKVVSPQLSFDETLSCGEIISDETIVDKSSENQN